METLLRKYLWAIDLGVIALCAMFLARAAATAIESRLVRGVPVARRGARARRRRRRRDRLPKQVEDILKRNIFCSTCPPILRRARRRRHAPPVPPLQRTSLQPQAAGDHVRAAAARIPAGRSRSSCDNDDKSTGAVQHRLEAARRDHQRHRRVPRLPGFRRRPPEYLDLLDRPAPAPGAPVAAAGPAVATDPPERGDGPGDQEDRREQLRGPALDGRLAAGNMGALARAARIVPEMRDGKAAGFRLFSIRPEGPFAKIGLHERRRRSRRSTASR